MKQSKVLEKERKKRNIIEELIIEKVTGFDDIPIEKLNDLVKKVKLK